MKSNYLIVCLLIALEVSCLFGDFCIKKATVEPEYATRYLSIAFLIYGISAFGWYYIMKTYTLMTSNALHALSTILVGMLIGSIHFQETLSTKEIIGIILACISFILLL